MRAEPFSLGGMPALRWGRPSRQGILYLHGQGGSKAEAAFFAAAAADAGWQTVSVDLPGHGDRESEAAALVPGGGHGGPDLQNDGLGRCQ